VEDGRPKQKGEEWREEVSVEVFVRFEIRSGQVRSGSGQPFFSRSLDNVLERVYSFKAVRASLRARMRRANTIGQHPWGEDPGR
jgi:hypothetical protein